MRGGNLNAVSKRQLVNSTRRQHKRIHLKKKNNNANKRIQKLENKVETNIP